MTVNYFCAGKLEFQINEKEQVSRILYKIHNVFQDSNEEFYVILDVIIGQHQYDMIFIKKDAIVSIEFKNYEGDIIGNENRNWFVLSPDGTKIEINDGKNVFRQVRNQRYQLRNSFNEILKRNVKRFENKEISHISGIVCFKGNSKYDDNQIDKTKHLWFSVENENTIIDYLKQVKSNEFLLKKDEIKDLIHQLGVDYFEINSLIDIEKEAHINDGNELLENEIINLDFTNLDLENLTQKNLEIIISFLFPNNKSTTTLQEINGKIKDVEFSLQLLTILKNRGLISQKDSHTIELIKDWKDILNNEEKSKLKKLSQRIFYKTNFWLSPNNSTEGNEYLGVYRGTKYHFNSSGFFWWEVKGKNEKLEFTFTQTSIKQKLLSIKPLGGSFRITENGEIITKLEKTNGEFIPVFVTNFSGKIVFNNNNIKWNPSGLKPGDLWPSIYDGVTMSVNSNGQLHIKVNEKKCYAIEGHEKIVDAVLKFRPQGGRIKITETGRILTLMYSAPYPIRIKNQLSELNDSEKNLIDIRHQTEGDSMVPIYLGTFSGNIKFKPPLDLEREWTDEDNNEFLSRIGVS